MRSSTEKHTRTTTEFTTHQCIWLYDERDSERERERGRERFAESTTDLKPKARNITPKHRQFSRTFAESTGSTDGIEITIG